MKSIKQNTRSSILFALITASLFVLAECVSDQTKQQQSTGDTTMAFKNDTVEFSQFSGPAVCAKCHASLTNGYTHTAHFLSSQVASAASIKGSFKKGRNSFRYDTDKIVLLEQQKDSFYQVYYHKGREVVKRRFDIVVGSGTKGQTYLSWLDNHLIELPVSYFTQVHQWANSPGYPLSPIIFNRPVTTRCLECHSTYAGTVNYHPDIPPVFDSTKMLLAIGCEKCHGPAAKHVAWQAAHPGDTTAKFIVNPGKLSRQMMMDVCGLCHSGKLEETGAPFQFTPGKNLSDYFRVSDAAQKTGVMDVHGNQLGILSVSKCFRVSKTLTCLTCHDPHKNERGNIALFSKRCMNCHNKGHTTIEGVTADMMAVNCIDCHMPLQESTSISFLLQGKDQPVNARMRTHFIKVYNDETKKFIEYTSPSQKKKKP